MTAATATLNQDAARALTLGEERAHANGHHAMIGAEYILYGIFAHFEQEPNGFKRMMTLEPFGFVTAEMIMSRIVLIPHHSDSDDDLMRCECYEAVLTLVFEKAQLNDSPVVDLCDLMLAITRDKNSLAFNILNHFMGGTLE